MTSTKLLELILNDWLSLQYDVTKLDKNKATLRSDDKVFLIEVREVAEIILPEAKL